MGIGAVAAGIGAVGSIAGGLISSSSAKSAADTQAQAATQAAQLTHDQYLQTRGDLAPYRDIGLSAFQRLGQIYGLNGPAAPAPAAGGGGGYGPANYSSAPGADFSGYNGAGTVGDFVGTGRRDLPNGNSLGVSAGGSGWDVYDQQGNVLWSGLQDNTPLQQVFGTLFPGTFTAQPSGGGWGQVAPATAGSDPFAGLSGVQYNPAAYGLGNGVYNPAAYGLGNGVYNPADYGLGNGTFNPAAYGLGNGTFAPTQAQLEATPGYQFTREQGLKSVQNSAAAKGLGVSGAAMKEAARYATGLADTTLQTQANIYNQNLANARNIFGGNLQNTQNIFASNLQNTQDIYGQNVGRTQGIFQQNLGNVINPLLSYAQLGENAAAQTGGYGASAINAQSNLLTGAANARAAGMIGSANAAGGALNSLSQAPLNYMLYNQLFSGGGGGGGGYIDSGTWAF